MNFWTWLQKLIQDWIASQTPKPTPPAPTPTPPAPVPVPPVPTPTPIVTETVIADFNLLPDQIRTATGIIGSDNEILWCLFSSYGTHEGPWLPQFEPFREPIKSWFTARVSSFADRIKQDDTLKITIFQNDRNDAGGIYLKDPIVGQLRADGILELWYKVGCVYIWDTNGGTMRCD